MQQVGIEIKNVIKEFPARRGEEPVRAVDNISLQIYEGEFFALLGPSGCGKTTTLRMIAGFEEPSSGEIILRGKPVQGVPPFHRPVNTVFQDYALFPHMTVLQNVMFGLEMAGVNAREARDRAAAALEMVRLKQFDRKPRQLSGGQQQRVALARALVKQPAVLLLDEPLGALDLKLRKEMQYELMQMQEELNMTFVYVTHDQEEALTMCDRIAVMDRGKVLQVGRGNEIYETPHSRFVADFIGETNFIEGKLTAINGKKATVVLPGGVEVEATPDQTGTSLNSSVTVAIRPEKITLVHVSLPTDQGLNARVSTAEVMSAIETEEDRTFVPGTIIFSNYIGTDTRYTVRIGESSTLIVREQNFGNFKDITFKVGDQVMVFWATENARVLIQ
ncbi:MAG: ABC transporter ATP-binding protein [Anaerolineae bacterium]|nr:ABC transporter ATP-binding protein [Anaerolineae bacterium]NUQ03786.1 ABC transporter ATP-binding protein [Anaerolineae bacterium]